MGEKNEIVEVYRKKGMRLTAEMSPLLHQHFYNPTAGKLNKGFHWFDKAHTVMLMEEEIVSKDIGVQILNALRQMEKEGVDKARNILGGHMHCGEAYVTKVLGPDVSGWIHCGRSSGDLVAVAMRVCSRDAIINFMKELNNLRQIFLKKAEGHIDTVMPGYTHLQHAEPYTFAFYLLSWVHQIERDFERFQGAYKHTNISPSGCAILTTTDFPSNRKRTQELLGFDGIFTNAKDAIWTTDFLLETLCCVVSTAGIMGRLADDLNIWHSSEFSMVEIPDNFCGTSSIMPQKKNPYGTEATRGLDSYVVGNLMSFLMLTKSQSDSCEIITMSMPLIFHAFNKCLDAMEIMAGVVKDLKIHKEVMKERAGMFWATATSLVNTIVREKKIPFRHAHQVVAILVRLAYEEGKSPKDITSQMVDRAAEEYNGQALMLAEEVLHKALDPAVVVKSKKLIGGTAPEMVKEDISGSLKKVAEDEKIVASLEANLDAAKDKLEIAINNMIGER